MHKIEQMYHNCNVKIPTTKEELVSVLEDIRKQLEKKMPLEKFDLSKLKRASHIGVLGPRSSGKTTLIKEILDSLVNYEKVYGIYFTSVTDEEKTQGIEDYLDVVTVGDLQTTDSYHASLLNWLQNWQYVLKKSNQPTVVCDDVSSNGTIGGTIGDSYRKFKNTCEMGSAVYPRRFIWSCQSNKFVDCQFLFVSPHDINIGDYVSNVQTINQMKTERGFFVVEFNKNNKVEQVFTFSFQKPKTICYVDHKH